MLENLQFCTFHLGPLFLGIDVTRVQEVLRPQTMTNVPHAPDEVRGLINLRGQIVTAIDLRRLLELPPRPVAQVEEDEDEEDEEDTQMNIVVHTQDGTVSFLVDAIGDVLDVPNSLRAPLPHTVASRVSHVYFSSVFKLEDRLLLILEPERVMERAAHTASARRLQ